MKGFAAMTVEELLVVAIVRYWQNNTVSIPETVFAFRC
jgi:hypothetical protein